MVFDNKLLSLKARVMKPELIRQQHAEVSLFHLILIYLINMYTIEQMYYDIMVIFSYYILNLRHNLCLP